MTQAEFQARVEALMREGWLFGAAVLQARIEVREEQRREAERQYRHEYYVRNKGRVA